MPSSMPDSLSTVISTSYFTELLSEELEEELTSVIFPSMLSSETALTVTEAVCPVFTELISASSTNTDTIIASELAMVTASTVSVEVMLTVLSEVEAVDADEEEEEELLPEETDPEASFWLPETEEEDLLPDEEEPDLLPEEAELELPAEAEDPELFPEDAEEAGIEYAAWMVMVDPSQETRMRVASPNCILS